MTLLSSPSWAADKVDNGDGTYIYDTALGYTGPTNRVDGVLTLSYVGPARYSWSPVLADGAARWDDGSASLTTDPRVELVGGMVVDEDFIEWEITAVDNVALDSKIATYFGQFSEAEGSANELVPAGASILSAMFDPSAGLDEEPGNFEFNSYTKTTCGSGSSKAKRWEWSQGSVDRIDTSAEFSTGETSAIVNLEITGLGGCSGILIDDRRVLTAAHCVFDESLDRAIDAGRIEVCQYNGYGGSHQVCVDVLASGVLVYGEYARRQKSKFDWAVLKIAAPLGAGGKHMALSRASDGRISSISTFDDHRLGGIPGIPVTNACTGNTDIHLSEDGSYDNVYSRTVLMDLTHADGDSGGAHYYDGSTPGGTWYVYGVHSGHWWAFNKAAKGPKVPFYHAAIIGLL